MGVGLIDEPSAGEVLEELARIAASSQFKKAATQTKLLSFVVEKALAGTPIMEVDIGCELDPHYNPESNKVRSNASIVREKLQVYYRSEGVNDLVRIEFPPGPNYRVQWSYHKEATVIRRYRQGLSLMKAGTPDSLDQADVIFWTIRDGRASFRPVYVAHAECRLLLSIANTLFDLLNKRDIHYDADVALGYLEGLCDESPEALPRFHLITGAARLLKGQIPQARTEFKLALEKDFTETSSSLWYAAYLFLAERDYEAALEITHAKKAAEPDSFAVRVVGAAFLYSDGQYAAAADWVADIYVRQGGELYEPLIIGLAHLAHKNYDIAFAAFSMASDMKESEFMRVNRFNSHAKFLDRFPGLVIMALVGRGKLADAEDRLAELSGLKTAKSFDLMVAYMALGRYGRSLIWYSRWALEYHFLLYWLEDMPYLAPLTKHPRYNALKLSALTPPHL